jgi:hypothetical protein
VHVEFDPIRIVLSYVADGREKRQGKKISGKNAPVARVPDEFAKLPPKKAPALTPNFASSPAVKRISLAMPHLRRQASLQTTSVVLQTRGRSEPLPDPCPPIFKNTMPGFANWGLD